MKRLFLLFAVMIAAVATSCDKKEKADDGTVKMWTVSENILTFNFWGGEHSSYYSIRNIPQDSIILANSSHNWVKNLNTKNIGEVRYVIEPNDSGVERDAVLTVSCDDASVEYSISQLAADVTCKAAYASCSYYGNMMSMNANYQLNIALKDTSNNPDGNILYSLDLYRKEFMQPGDAPVIPAGTYILGHDNTTDDYVIYAPNSSYSNTNGSNHEFDIAILTVSDKSLVFRASTKDGRTHLATFYGDYNFVDMTKAN